MKTRTWLIILTACICFCIAGMIYCLGSGAVEALYDGLTPIYSGDEGEKSIALMCNIYQGSKYAEQILDICNEQGVKITFYIGGIWAKDNQQLLQRISDAGHCIGNHGTRHLLHSRLDLAENIREIQECDEIVYAACGKRMELFQPPAGDYGNLTLEAAKTLGYTTTMWSVDTIDWRDHDPALHLKRIKEKAHNGAFILTHPTKETVLSYPKIIEFLREEGYTFKTVEEMINPG